MKPLFINRQNHKNVIIDVNKGDDVWRARCQWTTIVESKMNQFLKSGPDH